MKLLKKWYLLLPLTVFPVLFIPYSYLNSRVLVKKFGCGCPKIDDAGNIIENSFNANDFTLIFWNVIALGVVAASLFLMKKLPKIWMRVVYVLLMVAVSVWIALNLSYLMQWN